MFYTQPAPQQQPQQVYYVQQPVAPQPAAKPVKQVSKGRKIASLILGIHGFLFALAALFTCWIPALGIVYGLSFGIAGLIFSIIGTSLYKRGLAIAGIIISVIAMILAVVIFIIFMLINGVQNGINDGSFQNWLEGVLDSID